MKKALTFLFSFFVSTLATQAQTVLSGANSNPVPGDIYYGHAVDTNLSKGPAGPHVVWDFSSATEIGLDSTKVFACDSTPFCGTFPGSNIAEYIAGELDYYVADSFRLALVGVETGGTLIPFRGRIELLRYPTHYGDAWNDTISASIIASGTTFYHIETDSFIYDAWGTIKLPTGVDTDAVRVRNITHSYDSATGTPGQYAMNETYFWFVLGFHTPIMTIYYDTAGSDSGTSYVAGAEYYVQVHHSLSVASVNNAPNSLNIFPNPATEDLHVKFDFNGSSNITIALTDLLGRTVLSQPLTNYSNGTNEVTIPVSDIPVGMYVVKVQTTNGCVSQKVTITR